ncbi:MAG: Quinoprotein glucose dehydrogenase [Candidatus Curtissbacteria bacterium GW2011_GWC2_41_21]|nr:MAG: Quinoprotein glucose dehydrogenase [Candidatus Curtissbacteria bacterium GW2011_GWC2_41_21]
MYKSRNLIIIFIGILIIAILLGAYLFQTTKNQQIIPQLNNQETNTTAVSTVAEDLEIPWSVAFLPDGRMLVTERPGRVRMIYFRSQAYWRGRPFRNCHPSGICRKSVRLSLLHLFKHR